MVCAMPADPGELSRLGISQQEAEQLLTGLRFSFDSKRNEFLQHIENSIPENNNNSALKKMLTFRNKILAHQERLDDVFAEQLKFLPSLHEMEQLNDWATNFCLLAISLLTPNVTIIPNGPSARIAALNVAAKLLDKKLDNPAEYQSFFSKI